MALLETRNTRKFYPRRPDLYPKAPRVFVRPEIALFRKNGEYSRWLGENLLNPGENPFPPRESISLSGQTEKARMINAIGQTFPEHLMFHSQVFGKEEKREIREAIESAIEQELWVGIVTCYRRSSIYLGKGHYVMGLDNKETCSFFLGENKTQEQKQQEYEALRAKYPHFHMDCPNTLEDWIDLKNLREVVVFTKPPGHAYRHQDHFVAGVYLNGENMVVEVYPLSYHTRVQDRREGAIFTIKIPLLKAFREGKINITSEQAKKTREALGRFFQRKDIGSLGLNAPDEASLEKLCTAQGLTTLLRNIGRFFSENREEIVGALRNLITYGYLCVDFIGKTGEGNCLEYCKAFEAKGLNI